ncbi:non-structural protein 3a [Porcine respiratory coronavirus]|nr:non-structural protein 3a [Porcine respiratory coronavirus]
MSCIDIVKSINTSVDAVLDEFDCAYFAVTLKVEFKTGRLLVCIGFGDTLLVVIEEVNTQNPKH